MDSDCIRAADRNGHFYPARPCHVFAVFGGGTAKAHARSANLPCGCGVASACAQAAADSGCRLSAFVFGSDRDCGNDSGFAGWLGGHSTFAASHRWSCRVEYCPDCHRPGLPLPPQKYPCRSGHYHDDAAVSADSFL